MRFLLASVVLVSVLALGGGIAHADGEPPAVPTPPAAPAALAAPAVPAAPRIGLTGRCLEQPMSLALAIAEYEASRALAARSLVSPADPVVATPRGPAPSDTAEAPAPPAHRAPPPACLNSDDPGCRVSRPVSWPVQVHLDHVDHGGAPAAWVVPTVPRAPERGVSPPLVARDAPPDAHAREPWRPPAR